MDQAARDKWRKVKRALEAAGKTDCHYYQLALAALAVKPQSDTLTRAADTSWP